MRQGICGGFFFLVPREYVTLDLSPCRGPTKRKLSVFMTITNEPLGATPLPGVARPPLALYIIDLMEQVLTFIVLFSECT
jgi:hypothetical protein